MAQAHRIGGQWLDDLNTDLEGSERSCAVLAGAILDDRLLALIEAYLVPPKSSSEDRLLGRSGPLEPFASRIELARRLNLISDETRKALDWVRDIRNEASHKVVFSFDDDAISQRVRNIVDVLKLRENAAVLLNPPYDDIRGNFGAAVVTLVTCLQVEAAETVQTSHIPVDAMRDAKWTDSSRPPDKAM